MSFPVSYSTWVIFCSRAMLATFRQLAVVVGEMEANGRAPEVEFYSSEFRHHIATTPVFALVPSPPGFTANYAVLTTTDFAVVSTASPGIDLPPGVSLALGGGEMPLGSVLIGVSILLPLRTYQNGVMSFTLMW